MDDVVFDPPIDRPHRDLSDGRGLFGRDHECVTCRTLGAETRQRTARRPDDVELMDLDHMFSSVRFLQGVTLNPSLPVV
jgi:hypothetical protein